MCMCTCKACTHNASVHVHMQRMQLSYFKGAEPQHRQRTSNMCDISASSSSSNPSTSSPRCCLGLPTDADDPGRYPNSKLPGRAPLPELPARPLPLAVLIRPPRPYTAPPPLYRRCSCFRAPAAPAPAQLLSVRAAAWRASSACASTACLWKS